VSLRGCAVILATVEKWLLSAVGTCCKAFLLFALVLAAYQLFSRSALHASLAWSEGLVRLCLIWAVSCGSAVAFSQNCHLAIDFLHDDTSGWRKILFSRINLGLSLLFVGSVFLSGLYVSVQFRSQLIAGLDISISWSYAAFPVGALASFVSILTRLVNSWDARA